MVRYHHQLNGQKSEQTLEIKKDREAWSVAFHGVQRVRHDFVTEQQQIPFNPQSFMLKHRNSDLMFKHSFIFKWKMLLKCSFCTFLYQKFWTQECGELMEIKSGWGVRRWTVSGCLAGCVCGEMSALGGRGRDLSRVDQTPGGLGVWWPLAPARGAASPAVCP